MGDILGSSERGRKRGPKVGGRDITKIAEVLDVSEIRGECLLGGDVCSVPQVVKLIDDFVATGGDTAAPESRQLDVAKKILDCDTESCVITHKKFQDFVVDAVGEKGKDVLEKNLNERFKMKGPKTTKDWFNDKHIDFSLRAWALKFPCFYPYSFNMIDFDEVGGSLAKYTAVDVLEGKAPVHLVGDEAGPVFRPCACMGAVINTDVSTGPGKHWLSVFVDCRPTGQDEFWTVEYFNSSGSRPRQEIVVWMERTKARLISYRAKKHDSSSVKTVVASTHRHQNSDSECGPYALMYIRHRIENGPGSYEFFRNNTIKDKAMYEFRELLFREY